MSERIKEIEKKYDIPVWAGSVKEIHMWTDIRFLQKALTSTEAELQAGREKVKYYHDKNQEKCAEIDTLRQELAALRGRLAARRSYPFFAG